MEIQVKETTIVRPPRETPEENLWNSNLDLIVPLMYVRTVYFYKPCSNFLVPQVLKDALSDVLVPFYPVAGRLGKGEDGRISVLCKGQGVLFVEAETNSTVDELSDFTPRLEMLKFIPEIKNSTDIFSHPLLMVQVTLFKCGGVCLGLGLHHILADGTSALHFVNSWSEIARGQSITIPPFIDRTLLRARFPPNPTRRHVEYDPPPSMITPIQTQKNPKSICGELLTITFDQLTSLKLKSREEDNGRTIKYSTYTTLTAHIWRCVCKARGLSDDQPTRLFIPTDGRNRLNPTLPAGYFGNVLFSTAIIASSGEIQSKPFGHTVGKIHKALKRVDDEYLRSALDFLQVQPNIEAFKRGPHTFKSPNLNIVSWTTLPTHDADFGWGRPIFMGPANVAFEGTAYILRGPNSDGSLMVFISLETDHMKLFKEYFYDF